VSGLPSVDARFRAHVRGAFPALSSGTIFLENAGGSQVPTVVAQRMHDYLLESYVQLGAGYALSQRATRTVADAHAFMRRFMNAGDGHVILGSSTTVLLRILADCYGEILEPGAEIILAESGHEANMGPWRRLGRLGAKVRIWRMDPDRLECSLEELEELLGPKTALVCFPHVSNLLGEIVDVSGISRRGHAAGARVVADGVAYAPHRRIDVRRWDVDWYVFSLYKVYGPHMAALYGRPDALADLPGPNHFFIDAQDLPYKFGLGGPSHEGCAAILGLAEYLNHRLERPPETELDEAALRRAFDLMSACELPLQRRLLEYLATRDDFRIMGPLDGGLDRVGTISFVHRSRSSRSIASDFDRSEIALRHGHMYAYDLCRAAGLEPEDGVVRVSLVHYNTPAEIERVIDLLEEIR
jgi:cysteine desulfurase family protein (TIGR01976 family)